MNTSLVEWYISVVNQLFTAIYQFEILLQLNVWGLKFFRNWWNNFSECIILMSNEIDIRGSGITVSKCSSLQYTSIMGASMCKFPYSILMVLLQ